MIVFQLAILPLCAVLALFVCLPSRRRGRFGSAAWFRPAFALSALWLWVNACGWLQPVYNDLLDTGGSRCVDTAAGDAASDTPALRQAHFAAGSHPVIIVLGGGTDFTGPNGALQPKGDSIEKIAMAGACFARARAEGADPHVIVSGGNPQQHPMAEADVYAPDLLALGIPAADLTRENRSWNTYQNAEFVAPLVKQQEADQAHPAPLYLITTALHMHRSLLNFARFGMTPTPVTPPWHATHRTAWPSLQAFSLSAAALHEIVGTVVFHLYRVIGKY
jgi:uncharacterized SAM-binding protein YcdF (DUF218 family)